MNGILESFGVARAALSGDKGRAMSDSKTPPQLPPSDPSALACPVCGNPVDPRRTTQALSRNGRLMLFCSSGCLRNFVTTENAAKGR